MRKLIQPPLAPGDLFFLLCVLLLAELSGTVARAADPEPATEPPNPLNLSLKELVNIPIPKISGASKWEQPISQAPSSVSVLTGDDVKKYGYRTLADLLESVRGLHVSSDRNYSFLGIRGFNRTDFNNRVLVLVDGHRINNTLSDAGFIGTEFILDVDLIQQVEIIRGPVATLYGNNAFFGVINVVTRQGGSFPGYGAEVSGDAGSFDTYHGRATFGHKFKNELEVLLSGSLYTSQGDKSLFYEEFNSPKTQNGVAHNIDSDEFKSAFGTLRYRDFTLQGGYINRDRDDPTAKFENAFNDPRGANHNKQAYIDFKFEHDFEKFAQVMARLYYDRNDFTTAYPEYDPTVPLFVEEQAGERLGAELQLSREFFDRHRLTFGAEYRNDFHQQLRNFELDPRVEFVNIQDETDNYGVFLQGEFELRKADHHSFIFNAGVRYDQYGDFDPTVNPRLALIYQPYSKASIKAIYGTAFRAPNFFERLLAQDVVLVPETITTYELVYEQEFADHFRSSVAGYYNEIDDLISLQQNGALQNLKGATSIGGEFELEGQWLGGGLRGRASYAIQQTEDTETHRILTDSPEHLVKFNLSVPVVKEKLFGSVEFQYTTRRLSTAGVYADDFEVVNFTLFSQNLIKGLEASASVYNIFDNHYSDPASPFHRQALIEQNGRTFRVKMTYRF